MTWGVKTSTVSFDTNSTTLPTINTTLDEFLHYPELNGVENDDPDRPLWEGALPPSGYMVLFLLLAFSGVLGIMGNSAIILLSHTDKSLRHPFGFLLELLCWCGLLMSVLGTPFTALSNYSRQWLYGSRGCNLYAALMTVLGFMQENTLVLIAVYRYISLCKPMLKHRLTKRRLEVTSIVFLVEALLWAVAPLLGWGEYVLEGVGTSCGPNWTSSDPMHWSYNLAMAITHLAIPLPVLAFCYGSILIQLHRLRKVRNAPYLEAEKKVLPLILLITVGFILAYVPYGFLSVGTLVFGKGVMHPLVTTFPAIIMKMSCFWNSIIYVSTDHTYRSAVKRIFQNSVHPGTNQNGS